MKIQAEADLHAERVTDPARLQGAIEDALAHAPALLDVPERCGGGLIVRDGDGDGRPQLIRDGCATPGRLAVVWDGVAFVATTETP